MVHSQQLQHQLETALKSKSKNYRPRTHHLGDDGLPIYINRLILEDSPYLLQHAHNPVDWYPWGEKAFAAAAEQDKPIFLSIGYATCHWCHVMEEQSFEDSTVAELLNQHFICIKVDREQYPDIDAAYMAAVTMISGHGGWPMSSFLTPEGKPFYGGTYYPQASFLHLLSQISDAWHNQRDSLFQQAEQLADAVAQTTTHKRQIIELEQSVLQSAINTALANYDSHFGGFSAAPKFPQEPLLLLLLQSLQRQSNPLLFAAVEHTLAAMAQGGIYDQVGGGFHRYSVDSHWLIPHFEKMLYNQAYLARVYLHAYRLNHNPLHARIVTQTLDYVLREMRNHDGVFYSATDADSEGHEGTYFVWTIDEIKQLLAPEDARFIIELFGVTHQGNFDSKNILFLPRSLTAVSIEHQQSLEELCQRLDPLLTIMRQHRQQRVPPLTDDKILVAWNGMIITALAEAGHWLNEPRYIKAAEQAAASLWQSQRPKDSVLWRVNLNGQVSVAARQDDYVHFAEALLALFDVTDNKTYCQQAQQLAEEMLNKFLDNTSGALRMSNERLLFTRPEDSYDGALPSGNAVAVRVFSRLTQRSGQKIFQDHAIKILQTYSNNITQQPLAYAYMLAQLDELNRGEIADYQYAADGAIKISVEMTKIDDTRYAVMIIFKMHQGWYFNKGTVMTVVNKDSWILNQVEETPDNFELKINLTLANPLNYTPLKLHLAIHPCSQNKCLPVEDIGLHI